MSGMDQLDHRQIALVIARARAVNGLVMLLVPSLAANVVFGRAGRNPVVRGAMRLVGIRDLILGVGAITTLKEHTMDAEWVGLGAVADATDAAVMLCSPRLGARARVISLVGSSSAAVGYFASRALADERVPDPSDVDS